MLLFNDGHYTEEHFIASFISGVSEDMQAAIDMVEPKTLKHTIEVGKKHLLTMEAMARRLRIPPKVNNSPHNYKKNETASSNNQKGGPNTYQKAPIRFLTSSNGCQKGERLMF